MQLNVYSDIQLCANMLCIYFVLAHRDAVSVGGSETEAAVAIVFKCI